MHAYTYSFLSNLKFSSSERPYVNEEELYLQNKNNTFMSNRKLGDEFAYVLNRKGSFLSINEIIE